MIVVGPVGDHNAHYKSDARGHRRRGPQAHLERRDAVHAQRDLAGGQGRGAGRERVRLPRPRQRLAEHLPAVPDRDQGRPRARPAAGADGDKHVYYGEDYIRNNIRLAPNAVVLLYHLCYASGNTEPGLSQGTFADARAAGRQLRRRVHRRGRAGGDRGGPPGPSGDQRRCASCSRPTGRSTRSSATRRRGTATSRGRSRSQRTPGLALPARRRHRRRRRASTARWSATSALRASAVTGAPPIPTDASPADFVVPGAAEVVAADGVGLFGSLAKAPGPGGTRPPPPSPDGDAAAADRRGGARDRRHARLRGHRARDLDHGLRPRDRPRARATRRRPSTWSLDRSGALLSPNGDGANDELVVAARFSERVDGDAHGQERRAATTVRSASVDGDIVRFAWDLDERRRQRRQGRRLHLDPAGHATTGATPASSASGGFTLDATPPESDGQPASTAGLDGWRVSPVDVGDQRHGRAVRRPVDQLPDRRRRREDLCAAASRSPRNGTTTLEYRATDKAGIREPWQQLTLRIDTRGPTIARGLERDGGRRARDVARRRHPQADRSPTRRPAWPASS